MPKPTPQPITPKIISVIGSVADPEAFRQTVSNEAWQALLMHRDEMAKKYKNKK